jgi:hypothetical protein
MYDAGIMTSQHIAAMLKKAATDPLVTGMVS